MIIVDTATLVKRLVTLKMEKANFLYAKLVSLASRVDNLCKSNGCQTVNADVQVSDFIHLRPPLHSESVVTDDHMCCGESEEVTSVKEAVSDKSAYPNCENTDEVKTCPNNLCAPEAVQSGNYCKIPAAVASCNILLKEAVSLAAKEVLNSNAMHTSTGCDLLSTANDSYNAKAVNDAGANWNMLSAANESYVAKTVNGSGANWNMLSKFGPTTKNIVCSDGRSCLNGANYVATHKQNEAFGVKLPDDTTFMEICLESSLSQDYNNNTMDAGSESMSYDTLDSSNNFIEFDVTNCDVTNEADGSESMRMLDMDDHETLEFCSNDDTIDVDIVNCDAETESTVKSSHLFVTENSTADSLISRKYWETQPTLEDKDKTPWKIVIKPNKSSDDTKMVVPVSGPKAKLYFCIYCLRRVTKFARHLQNVHPDEADVKEFLALPIGLKQRKDMIGLILKRGKFEWNSNAELNDGQFSTCRRPNKKFGRTTEHFTPCPKCLGSISTNTLSRHFKNCSNNALNGERKVKQLSRAVDGRLHPSASDDLKNIIFPKLKSDTCVRSIRFDWVLIEYSNDLCLRHHAVYQNKLIRDKIRGAAKVLAAAKSISTTIKDFSSLFLVDNSTVVIKAVQKVAKYDIGAKSFGTPGTATTLVTLIKDIGDFLKTEYMRLHDLVRERDVKRFIKVFTKDAKLKINKLAADTQSKARRLKQVDMPSTDDVNRFTTYLDNEMLKCFAALSEGYTYEKWVHLSEVTLVSVLAFNRKRTGEMRNILVDEFQTREMLASYRDKLVKGEIPQHTSQLIKSRVILRGKKNRDVEILLKHSYDDSIELLLSHRENARIAEKNEFLFALYSATGEIITVDACGAVNNFSKKCNAEDPKSLRGTKLRKHLASMCALMNLSDNGVTNVAKFMGHDNQVHRDTYRQNTLCQQVTQISDILERAQGNNVNVSKTNDATLKAITAKETQIRAAVVEAEKAVHSNRKSTKNTPAKKKPHTNLPTVFEAEKANHSNRKSTKNEPAKKKPHTNLPTVFEAEKANHSNRKSTKNMPAKKKQHTNLPEHQNIVATPGIEPRKRIRAARIVKSTQKSNKSSETPRSLIHRKDKVAKTPSTSSLHVTTSHNF